MCAEILTVWSWYPLIRIRFFVFFVAADMLSDTEIVKDHAGLHGPFLRAGKVSKRSAASVLARRFECERAHDFVSEGHEVRGLRSKCLHAKAEGVKFHRPLHFLK